MEDDDDFFVECSDEELYNPGGGPKGTWEPRPEDIVTLYEKIVKGDIPELVWKCPGRRSPSPEKTEEDEAKAEEVMELPPEELKFVVI